MMAGEYGTAARQERALYPSHLFSLLLAYLGQVSSPRFPFVKQELWYVVCISVIHCLFIPGMSSIAMVHFNSQLGVWKPDRCSPCVWYWSCPNKPCWSQQLHPSTVTLGSLPTCLPEFRVYQALTCIFFKCPHLVRDSYVGISSADNEWFCAFIVERLFFCNL